jgi:hypothetical protein
MRVRGEIEEMSHLIDGSLHHLAASTFPDVRKIYVGKNQGLQVFAMKPEEKPLFQSTCFFQKTSANLGFTVGLLKEHTKLVICIQFQSQFFKYCKYFGH